MKQKASRRTASQQVTFANVDLVLEAKFDLSILLAALAPRTLILFADVRSRSSTIRAELKREPRDAESGVLAFTSIAKSLPRPAKQMWNRAQCGFDVGFYGGFEPRWAMEAIGPRALRAALDVGASILMTAYAANRPARPRRSTTKRQARSTRRP